MRTPAHIVIHIISGLLSIENYEVDFKKYQIEIAVTNLTVKGGWLQVMRIDLQKLLNRA